MIAIPIGRPDVAAEMLTGAMTQDDLAALARLLSRTDSE